MQIFRLRPFLICAIVTAAAAGLFHLSTALTAKSDVFYIHFIGYSWFEPERAEHALGQHATAVPEQAQELRRRELSAKNYPVAAVAGYAAARLFAANLTVAIGVGLAIPLVIGIAVATGGLWRVPKMDAPFALAVSIAALTGFLPGPSGSDHLMSFGGLDNLLNLIVLAVDPGEALSPLSIWPKSTVVLIFMAVLANRWSGRLEAGYALLAATIAFHLTLGGLMLFGVAVMDLALRRGQVSSRWLGFAFALALAALALGQWRIVAEGEALLAVGVVALAVVTLVAQAWQFGQPLGARELMPAVDTGAIVLAAMVFTPAAMAFVAVTHTETSLSAPESVFVQLAARLIVVAVATAIFAASVKAMRFMRERNATQAALVAVGFVSLFTIYGAAGSWWWEIKSLPERMHDTGARSQSEPLTDVYYRALRTLGVGARDKAR